MTTSEPPNEAYAPFSIKEFRFFIAGRFIYIMGIRMTVTVIGWWMYVLTNSKLALGFVGLSEVIPAVSLALYAGHHIDRTERRRLLLRCILLYGLCIIMLFALSTKTGTSELGTWMTAALICAVIAITGVIRAFSGPTFATMIAQIVPRNILPAAATISSATWLIGSIVGHAAGGFLIAAFGINHTFIFIFAFVVAGYFILRQLQPKPAAGSREKNTWKSMKEGLDYVFNTKELLGAISLDLFAVLFGGAIALVPVFAIDILQVGPMGFGWLNAATDIGAITMVIWLTIRPLKRKQGLILFYAVGGFGLCMILFALSKVFWLSFAALLLSGCMDGISVVIRGTILQLRTPDELRGRVMAVNSMFINSSNEFGQFESGVMARLMGTVPSVIFGGCMTLAVVAITWLKAPSLRKMQY